MIISSEDKFSNVDEKIYWDLINFIRKLCHRYHNDNNIMMDFDEIYGELLLELVKGLRYPKYVDLPYQQRLAVLRRMLDNRMSELIYRYYVTNRKVHNNDLSYEQDMASDSVDGDTGSEHYGAMGGDEVAESDEAVPEMWVESMERVRLTRAMLSDAGKQVLDCVISSDNPRLLNIIILHLQRSATTKTKPTMSIKPWMVADVLLMTEKEVSKAFKEIKMAYKKVCDA